MESRTLVLREPSPVIFEITWEDLQVEMAAGPVGGEAHVDLRTFVTHDEVREFVEEQLARRHAEGYEEATLQPARRPSENAELESLIRSDPEAEEPYLVYADWLQGQADPRGELIMLQHALGRGAGDATRAAEQKLLQEHAPRLVGELAGMPALAELRFHLGFVRRAWLFREDPRSYDADAATLLQSLLGHASYRFMRELILSRPDDFEEDELLKGLIAAGPRPTLRRLQLGLPGRAVSRRLPSAVLELCPDLRELDLFGGPLELEGPGHPKLQLLLLQGRLDAELLRALRTWQLPALESLDLAHQDWSVDSLDLHGIAALLDGAWCPRLSRLALRSPQAESAAVICQTVLDSPFLPRLASLELSLGAVRGEWLLAGAGRLIHLHPLRLSGPASLAEAGAMKLREAGIDLELGPVEVHDGYRMPTVVDQEDGSDDEEDEYWDEEDEGYESAISDYDLGEPVADEPEEPEGEEEDDEEGGLGVDNWERPREDPFDIDDG